MVLEVLPRVSQDWKVKKALEVVLEDFFGNSDWALGVFSSVKSDELTIARAFKLRSVVTNYLQACPHFMVDSVFYTKIFNTIPRLGQS